MGGGYIRGGWREPPPVVVRYVVVDGGCARRGRHRLPALHQPVRRQDQKRRPRRSGRQTRIYQYWPGRRRFSDFKTQLISAKTLIYELILQYQ